MSIWHIKKLKRVISLNLWTFTHFANILQSLKPLTLVYPTLICFHFPPSVRIFCEILTNPAKITHISLIPKLHHFLLQNDIVLTILPLIFYFFRKILIKKNKKEGNQEPDKGHPHGRSGVVRPPPKGQKKKNKTKQNKTKQTNKQTPKAWGWFGVAKSTPKPLGVVRPTPKA